MLVIATPQAAIDDAGMQYTSAAEGFYGSLRLELNQEEVDAVTPSNAYDRTGLFQRLSRLGVKGSVDLGRGLTATYHYEFNASANDGAPVGTTRLHNIGLEGEFGTLLIGTQWTVDYNYVWGNTDIMNYRSGILLSSPGFSSRQSNVISYASPDFDGFNFAVGLSFDPQPTTVRCRIIDADIIILPTPSFSLAAHADNCPLAEENGFVFPDQNQEAATIDRVAVGVGYSVGGLDVGGTYTSEHIPSGQANILLLNDGAQLRHLYNIGGPTPFVLVPFLPPAGTTFPAGPATYLQYDDDLEVQSWGASLGYGENNWALDYYFGVARQHQRTGAGTNTNKTHSLAGQLQIDKVTLRALRELSNSDFGNLDGEIERNTGTLGAQYDLGIKSRIYFEYYFQEGEGSGIFAPQSQDLTGWSLGYRVDF